MGGTSAFDINFAIEGTAIPPLKGLSELSTDQWTHGLNSAEYDQYDLVKELVELGAELQLASPYRDALKEYTKIYISGKPRRALSDNWKIYIDALQHSVRVSYIDQVIDDVCDNKDSEAIIALFAVSLKGLQASNPQERQTVEQGVLFVPRGGKNTSIKLAC